MDNLFLTGPLGTQWNIGSWLDKTAGVDYGAAGLVRQQFGQNAWAEGARLGFESAAGPRRMTFPLIVPSGGLFGLSLDAIEGSLRQMVRPGGFIDLQPANVPTGEMVRFDILGGDVAHRNYSVDLQRVSRRQYTLSLDTQPFGYWPTWIICGSVASVALNGLGKVSLSAPPIGDVPAQLELKITPVNATQADVGMLWYSDGLVWANGARPSFIADLVGPSWAINTAVGAASYVTADTIGRTLSPTQAQVVMPAASGWVTPFSYTIASALEPAYRGRFRVFAQLYDQLGRPHQVAADVMAAAASLSGAAPAFASAAVVATMPVASGGFNAWSTVDLGELTLPAQASGVQAAQTIRIWAGAASWGATSFLKLPGLYLLPLDGQAGYVTRGLAQPSINANSIQLSGVFLRPDSAPRGAVGDVPVADLSWAYRGALPRMGATVVQLDLFRVDRQYSVASRAMDTYAANPVYGAVSVRYQPRFQFLKGF